MESFYQAKLNAKEPKQQLRFAGIHLSGFNVNRTSVVVLKAEQKLFERIQPKSAEDKNLPKLRLSIEAVYSKIGSQSRLFSDDRIVDILSMAGSLENVFVDCPISVPPCISCQRSQCPGVSKCEDITVAYMLSIAKKQSKTQRKRRSLNPQNQRLWDVMHLSKSGAIGYEPTYSSQAAPLVHRAKTLQKRINASSMPIQIEETSVALSLQRLAPWLDLDLGIWSRYRNFEAGSTIRENILEAMEESDLLMIDQEVDQKLLSNLEVFQALVAAIVAAMHRFGFCPERPADFIKDEGWVYLPVSKMDNQNEQSLFLSDETNDLASGGD